MYFNKHLGIGMCPNHWTYKEESKLYDRVAYARQVIKQYKLKNVEVEYDK
jgi:hypothetical protein